MPLVAALRCASDVAKILSELHQQGRPHGRLTPASVVMKESGAELLPSRAQWEQGAEEHDVAAFGALLYEVIMGAKPPVDASAGTFRAPGPNSGLLGIRAAAMRLAGKCLGYFPVTLSMQQAATEVRLLWVVARQFEAGGATDPPPMAAPFLVGSSNVKPRSTPVAKAAPAPAPPRHEEPVRKAMPAADDVEAGMDLEPGEPLVHPGASDFTRPEEETKANRKVAEGAPPCPKCDGSPVYVSRPRSPFERRLVGWRIPIYRCHSCYHRYIVVLGMRIHKSMPKHIERRFRPKRRA
jgi:hypothetical protein